METYDPEVVYDLRHLNEGRRFKLDSFWDAAKAYIESCALQAVDSKRHGKVFNVAMALSV